jgi:HK97 family phage major capsid protein
MFKQRSFGLVALLAATLTPGMAIAFDTPDRGGASGPSPEIKALEEAVGIFTAKREELDAEIKKYGELTQETKNNLEKLQDQVDTWETKHKRPALVKPGDEKLTDEQIERKAAFYKILTKGVAAMEPAEMKLLQTADDGQGGFLSPTQLTLEIIKDLPEFSPVRSVARVRSTTAKSVTFPQRVNTPVAQWTGEGGTFVSTNALYGSQEIACHPLTALSIITADQLEDSAFNMQAELTMDGAEQFGVAEAAAFVIGDGNKKPLGFMADPAVLANFISGGTATQLLGDDLIKLFYALKPIYANRGTWAMNRQTLRVIRTLKDGQGRYLWDANLGLSENRPATILERPYIQCPDMVAPAVNGTYTTGQTPVCVADFSQYTIVDRVSMSVIRDDTTLSDKGMVRFPMRKRVGGQATLPAGFQVLKIS